MIPVLTGASVATHCVFADGVPVTVVWIAIRTLILTDTLASPVDLIEASLAFAQTIYTTGVLDTVTVGVGCAYWCCSQRLGFLYNFNRLGYRSTIVDTVPDKIVVAFAKCCCAV